MKLRRYRSLLSSLVTVVLPLGCSPAGQAPDDVVARTQAASGCTIVTQDFSSSAPTGWVLGTTAAVANGQLTFTPTSTSNVDSSYYNAVKLDAGIAPYKYQVDILSPASTAGVSRVLFNILSINNPASYDQYWFLELSNAASPVPGSVTLKAREGASERTLATYNGIYPIAGKRITVKLDYTTQATFTLSASDNGVDTLLFTNPIVGLRFAAVMVGVGTSASTASFDNAKLTIGTCTPAACTCGDPALFPTIVCQNIVNTRSSSQARPCVNQIPGATYSWLAISRSGPLPGDTLPPNTPLPAFTTECGPATNMPATYEYEVTVSKGGCSSTIRVSNVSPTYPTNPFCPAGGGTGGPWDCSAPTVASWIDGKTGIATSSGLDLDFSKEMDPVDTVKALTFTPPTQVSTSWDSTHRSLHVTPNTPWLSGTQSAVTFAQGATDTWNMSLAPSTIVFTTERVLTGTCPVVPSLTGTIQLGQAPATSSATSGKVTVGWVNIDAEPPPAPGKFAIRWRGVVSYDCSALFKSATGIKSSSVTMTFDSLSGVPFANGRVVNLSSLSFNALSVGLFDAPGTSVGPLFTSSTIPSANVDLSSAVGTAFGNGVGLVQLQAYVTADTGGVNTNMGNSINVNSQALSVTYNVP